MNETATGAPAERDSFEEEFSVDGEPRVLLPEGQYEAVCVKAEVVELFKFGRSRKVFLHFDLYGGVHAGQRLFMPMATPPKGHKVGRGSKLYANYLIANDQPPGRRDRLSLKVFKNRLFRVMVKTVTPTFEDGRPKPALFHYSVVTELLERLA